MYFTKIKYIIMATIDQLWSKPDTEQLAQVLVAINNESDMQKFLCDVMTEKEIVEISARLRAAQMLKQGATYIAIVAATKLSSRTVARISSWLQNGTGGYEVALKIISTHQDHTPPARAE
jgi:TrpR-related protein YerC/YecD